MVLRRIHFLILAAVLLALSSINARAATDPEIDKLLKKLPAPEKLVKADQRVLRVNDPALRDPIVKQIEDASRRNQVKRAAELSRQLTVRYPKSAAAHTLRGIFTLGLHQYGEASHAFQSAIAIQPEFAFCHYALAASEFQQKHYASALPHARRVTQLEPRAPLAWGFLSVCAQAVGKRDESVSAARRLTALAPREPGAWMRLSEAEKAAGNSVAASKASRRAVEVARTKPNGHALAAPSRRTR